MPNRIAEENGVVILDGGLGTMLQAAGLAPGQRPEEFMLQHPEKLVAIHTAYVQAGAHIICANTFGANAHKLAGTGLTVPQVVEAAVRCARQAAGSTVKVALDVGPLGEMLEPGGTLAFEDAYEIYREVMVAGQNAGADLVLIETMSDMYEVKAAVLAASENTALPVAVSMTFEQDGRTFSGTSVEAFAAAVGGLAPVALGINCSLGPAEIMPLLRRLCAATHLPVFAKPNAGLPNPTTGAYTLSPQNFCAQMEPCLEMGVSMVGGCCGTTPETIALLARYFAGKTPAVRQPLQRMVLCGATRVVVVREPVPVGERMNPTGRIPLQKALASGDLGYLQSLAVQQEEEGALILGLNVGAPGVDEVDMLPRAVKAVQAVTGLPLQLDSSNPAALAAALRVYNGKPTVNSTSGEAEKMKQVLPLCRKYGAALVGLTLDEGGIPSAPHGRLAIAERIVKEAQKLGIPKRDIIIDCLTMTVGATPEAGEQTLRAVRLVKEHLDVKTMLGVSNVSYGLPNRPLVNSAFLAMALSAGLDLPIINTADRQMMGMLAAGKLLCAQDKDAAGYLAFDAAGGAQPAAQGTAGCQGQLTVRQAIEKGLKEEAAAAARAFTAGAPGQGMDMVAQQLIPALDTVGRAFEEKRVFLPQLLAAAGAAQAVFAEVRAAMNTNELDNGPPVVVATVQGDVHDIGKNIAKVIMENYGFTVIDLGRDVPPERVVEAVQSSGARLVGLSALMTTTLPAMQKTIQLLKEGGLPCSIMVGGAVLTPEYASRIGADRFVADAMASADFARQVYGIQPKEAVQS